MARVRIGTAAPIYEDRARTLAAVQGWVDAARADGCTVLSLPQECVLLPEGGEPIPGPTYRAIAAMAQKAGIYVAANLRESAGERTYLSSFLISPSGELIAKYRKTHGYSWERDEIALGDKLEVFDTPLGKVSFLVGSDMHFPEAAMVPAWLGARLLFWATEPEPVRDVHRFEQILRLRASDELLTIVASDYAGRSSWYSHSVRKGRVGLPIGRSCVVTPAGEFAADTSYRAGLGVATVDVPETEPPSQPTRPLYLYPRSGGYLRQYDCTLLTEPVDVPDLPEFTKRTAKIVMHPGGPTDAALMNVMAEEKPDLVLLPEYGGPEWRERTETFEERNLPALKALARNHSSYVVAGGIQGETWSMAYVFDRTGEIQGKYAQMSFELGHGYRVFDTDFCRFGIVVCNDMMFPEISRAEFLLGAELLLCPSQYACPSGMHNHRIMAARAIDNCVYYGVVLPCNEDPWQRVSMVDPYGVYTAQGAYNSPGIPVVVDVDFTRGVTHYVPTAKVPMGDEEGKVPGSVLPTVGSNLRTEIFAARRPELYGSLCNPAGPHPIYAPGQGPAALPDAKNLALGKPYTLAPAPNDTCFLGHRLYGYDQDPGDATDLTDGTLATGGLEDDRWVVWRRSVGSDGPVLQGPGSEVGVTVDLQSVQPLDGLAAHLWSDPASRAPFPGLRAAVSADGTHFEEIATTTAAAQGYFEPAGWPRVDWFLVTKLKTAARYVRFTFVLTEDAERIAVDEVAVYALSHD